jgi:hypothetical protein
MPPSAPRFLRSASVFRRWLASRHADASELWVGFYKTGSGKRGIRYAGSGSAS